LIQTKIENAKGEKGKGNTTGEGEEEGRRIGLRFKISVTRKAQKKELKKRKKKKKINQEKKRKRREKLID